MGWCATHHRLTLADALSVCTAAVLFGGCAITVVPPAPGLAARLSAALADDEAAFTREFASTGLGGSWYVALNAGRATIEAGASPTELRVGTQFPGDRRRATQTIALVLADDGRIVGSRDAGPRPTWAHGVSDVTAMAGGTLLSVGLDAAGRQAWVGRMTRAASVVAASGVVDGWDGGLVVEIPADEAGFTAATGSPAADTAALTSCDSGTPRIVINPASFSQEAGWLAATLTHEAVHVATDSACTTGTSWVVEGVAESVTAAADPATARANAALVAAYLRDHTLPTTLPASVRTQTDYALAQVAVDQVRRRLGDAAPSVLTRGITGTLNDADLERVTSWYIQELTRRR